MEEFLKGTLFGAAMGLVVGGVVVAKNKTLASKIRSGFNTVEEKAMEVKECLEEKTAESNAEAKQADNKKSKNQ
ncbi:MAG: hypothetical protein IJ538_01385 [Clostridia bacterium]|nr:hypothetical protein [Clostridia bacterium]